MPEVHVGKVVGLGNGIPENHAWPTLVGKSGDELEVHYRHVLQSLAREPGLLGTIFRKSQNKITEPAQLEQIINMIHGEAWSVLDADVKGDIYEGLLERGAADRLAVLHFLRREGIPARLCRKGTGKGWCWGRGSASKC